CLARDLGMVTQEEGGIAGLRERAKPLGGAQPLPLVGIGQVENDGSDIRCRERIGKHGCELAGFEPGWGDQCEAGRLVNHDTTQICSGAESRPLTRECGESGETIPLSLVLRSPDASRS